MAELARRARGWVAFVDRLVPVTLHRGDPLVRLRARVIVFQTTVICAYAFARAGLELALEENGWRAAAPLVLGALAGLGVTTWLWRLGDTDRVARAGLWLVGAVAVTVSLAKGGLSSPGLVWFAVIPVMARACAGRRAIWVSTAMVLVFLLACGLADLIGLPLPAPPTGTLLVLERVVALVAATVLCAGLVNMHSVFEEEAQRALVAARDAATSASRTKSLFVANVSHEIRTPMTAILGYTDILAEPELTETERRDAIETLRRNGHHLLALINDMLDLSKIEAGGLEVRLSETSPISVAQHVVALLRERARVKGLLLDLELGSDVPELIHTDALRLQQILVNLVGNAIKFTEQGGVRLSVSRDPEQGLRPERLRFEVSDSGIGIAPVDSERVFAPFSQADPSASRRYGGTGLGLAISRGLAQQLGGTLELDSELGRGSTFRLLVPVGERRGSLASDARLEAELAARGAAPAREMPSLRGRVLVAEDGPDNQRLIERLLTRTGLTVQLVADGRAAIEAALRAEREGRAFDAVIMDMQMPELDGYAATQALRDGGYARPIIALSAHAMVEDRERCLACGCNAFAAKPIDRRALLELLAEHLNKS